MRRAVLGLITVVALCLASLAPAQAATRPARVGLVSYTAATTSSLTVAWNKVNLATNYQVYVSSSYSGVLTAGSRATTSGLRYTITGLRPNTDYFVQVRARNGSTPGSRSARVGHSTIKAAGPMVGSDYSVMSYNVCSRVCENEGRTWASRKGAALERITHLKPDVVALQESECDDKEGPETGGPKIAGWYAFELPATYAETTCKSAKRLLYKKTRFDLAMSTPEPVCTAKTPARSEKAATPQTESTPEPEFTPETESTPEPQREATPETVSTPGTVSAPETESTPEPELTPETQPATEPPPAKVTPKVAETCAPAQPEPRTGWIQLSKDSEWPGNLGSKYAVWAELVDKPTNRHAIFVSVHLVAGSSNALAERRRRELVVLVNELAAINTAKLPVIRRATSTPTRDVQTTPSPSSSIRGLLRCVRPGEDHRYQHYNSLQRVQDDPDDRRHVGRPRRPCLGRPKPDARLVLGQRRQAVGGKYPTPIPSDHNPIIVTVPGQLVDSSLISGYRRIGQPRNAHSGESRSHPSHHPAPPPRRAVEATVEPQTYGRSSQEPMTAAALSSAATTFSLVVALGAGLWATRALTDGPDAPSELSAKAVSPTEVVLDWKGATTPTHTSSRSARTAP